MSEIQAAYAAAVERIDRSAVESVSRGQVQTTTDTTAHVATQVALLEDEVEDDVELFGPQGWYVRPKAGAEGIALAVLGDPDHRVMTSASEGRPVGTAEEGEGGAYQSGRGWFLFIDRSGVVSLGSGEGRGDESDPDDARDKPTLRLHPDGSAELLRKDGAPTLVVHPSGRVDVFSSDIRLGGDDASDPLVRKSLLDAELAKVRSAHDVHKHTETGTTTGIPDTLLGPTFPANTGSSVVKVDG